MRRVRRVRVRRKMEDGWRMADKDKDKEDKEEEDKEEEDKEEEDKAEAEAGEEREKVTLGTEREREGKKWSPCLSWVK